MSNIENGRYGRTNIDVLDRIGDVLGIWFDLDVRSRAADLDRLVNAKHAALGEQVIDWICACPGWTARAEVSFAFGCDAGVVDILAYHAGTRMLAVIELKTGIYDVGELLGTLHRKLRLAKRIAAEQGWAAEYVSGWLVVSDSRTNRRRVAAHRALVSSQMPADGRQFASWFARPTAEIRGRTFWSNVSVGGVRRVYCHPGARQSRPDWITARCATLTVARSG